MGSATTEAGRIRSMPSVDAEYQFGRPLVYLSMRDHARLLIFRSKLQDAAMRADYDAEYCFGPAPHHIEADA